MCDSNKPVVEKFIVTATSIEESDKNNVIQEVLWNLMQDVISDQKKLLKLKWIY